MTHDDRVGGGGNIRVVLLWRRMAVREIVTVGRCDSVGGNERERATEV